MRRLICRLLTRHKRVIFDQEVGAFHCWCGTDWTPRPVDLEADAARGLPTPSERHVFVKKGAGSGSEERPRR